MRFCLPYCSCSAPKDKFVSFCCFGTEIGLRSSHDYNRINLPSISAVIAYLLSSLTGGSSGTYIVGEVRFETYEH